MSTPINHQLQESVFQAIGDALQKHGFRRSEKIGSWFERTQNGDYELIPVGIRKMDMKGDDYAFQYSVNLRMGIVENIWDKYRAPFENNPLEPTLKFNSSNLSAYDPGISNGQLFLSFSSKAKDELLKTFADEFENQFMPVIDKMRDVRQLDRFLNQPVARYDEIRGHVGGILLYKKIIAAKLAGNANYPAVVAFVRDKIMEVVNKNPSERNLLYKKVLEDLTGYLDNM